MTVYRGEPLSIVVLPSSSRKGIASIWAMVILGIISVVSVATMSQFAAARRQTDAYRNGLQADLLARSGYELAVAKLLAEPKEYTGEKLTPIPGSEVKITVTKDPGENGTYRIESVVHYPTGERNAVARTIHRTIKRVEGPKGVQIEPIADVP